MNYYNEIDPFAAAWLRNLIAAGHISKGDVDERDIRDIKPSELKGYAQCHFFAGVGVWSYALRSAGWPDDRPVWTGSCPCQPFSTAGKGAGFADERHLWPSWFHLISQCKPDTIFGEQVKAAIKQNWLDLVQDDLEAVGYSCGAVPFPACSVGAPHIRQRVYFVADSRGEKSGRISNLQRKEISSLGRGNEVSELAHSVSNERRQECEVAGRRGEGSKTEGLEQRSLHSIPSGMADNSISGLERSAGSCVQENRIRPASGSDVGNAHVEGPQGRQFRGDSTAQRLAGPTGLVNGFWRDAEWLYCRDEKYRAVEPGTFPLAYGSPNRVGRLRGCGNAIVAPQAQAFIESYLEIEKETND